MVQKVRIYCRSKSVTQSGRDNAGVWVLEAIRPSKQTPEPLMGWTQSGDTLNQVSLEFPTKDSAETFAKSKGWRYITGVENTRRVKPRNYSDNFKYVEPVD